MTKYAPCPPNELGEPKKRFADTFSAIKLLIEHFQLERLSRAQPIPDKRGE